MARDAQRRRSRPLVARWYAVRDGRGQWAVVNDRGQQPLRDPDPSARLDAVTLAAAAPELRAMLQRVLGRFEALVPGSWQSRVDRRLAQEAHGVLVATRPLTGDLTRAARSGPQLELDLDVA